MWEAKINIEDLKELAYLISHRVMSCYIDEGLNKFEFNSDNLEKEIRDEFKDYFVDPAIIGENFP